jgi:hypothetical protein
LQAVYTRSITSPSAGGRVTGRAGSNSYTALYAHDRGEGLVVIPGAENSDFALQDFASDVGVLSVRHDIGLSSVSFLGTAREIGGDAHNAVFGPDVRLQLRPTEVVEAQALWSDSKTPNRPDLATEWDGRSLSDNAMLARWSHGARTNDFFVQAQRFGTEFRADEGFIPQVGYRELYVEGGYTIRPQKQFFTRVRFWGIGTYDDAVSDGHVLVRHGGVGFGADGKWNSFTRLEINHDQIESGGKMFDRFRPRLELQASPSRKISDFSLDTYFGQEIDFDNNRRGTGLTSTASVSLHAGDHLELAPSYRVRWIDVDDAALGSGRLFLAQVDRLRATYSFSARASVRLIGQYQVTTRDPSLYTFAVSDKSARFDSSALVAYKLNWQTVTYLGYGDNRMLNDTDSKLVPGGRQIFAKVSYAIQQ